MRKKTFLSILLMVSAFLLSSFNSTGHFFTKDPVPLDPSVRTGVLPNGMKYFIRVNKLPEKRAEFYIAHNVGAIQEEDDQNGLAHFTEHMAFNGTQNFPKKGILNYLETLGVKFGQNVNAGTGLESTVYNLSNVPMFREGIIDSALLILHDWSNYISFLPEEIELERGVIREEWRMYGSADERMSNQLAPIIYKGSKYAKRNVIGDTAVINHFKHQTIKDFYHKWYRPDLQAIIVVGDFDADKMEAKIKNLFGGIPSVQNPEKKVIYDVPDNAEPLIGTAKDIEATNTQVSLLFKHNKIDDSQKDLAYMRNDLLYSLAYGMLGTRLNELVRTENPPFIGAYCYYSQYAGNKDAFTVFSQARDNESLKALNAMLIETERMKRYGFTPGEFGRIKANTLRSYETAYNDRDKRKNRQLIYPIISNFLSNEPNPGIEYEYDFIAKTLPGISLDEINKVAREFITENNIVITITGPDKEGVTLPLETEIKNVLLSVKSLKIDPYDDKLANQKLVEKEPIAGKIAKISINKVFGTTEWTLSNGMKIVFKSTDFKAEEVIMDGYSAGGMSLVSEDNINTARFFSSLVSEMGVAGFSRTDLTKLLAGKRVSTSLAIGNDRDMISGNFSVKDIETQLQLVYLAFTNPRWNETEFKTWQEKMKERYKNMEADPRNSYYDTISMMVNNHHPRVKLINYQAVSELKLENFKQLYADRFCDPGNFTIIFTGKINPDEAKPLIEKYLASLPTVKRNETYKDNGVRVPKGKVTNDFKRLTTTPRTSVYVNFNFKCQYIPEEVLIISALRHILELRYTEAIREDKGGTYHVGVSATPNLYPYQMCNLVVEFETDPLKADDLISVVHKEISKILENGPQEADLQKAKEFFLKSRPENLKENAWWRNTLSDYYFKKIDTYTGYETMVKNLNIKQLQAYAKSHLTNPDVCSVVMRPL